MFASLARPDDDNELHWLKVCFSLYLFFVEGMWWRWMGGSTEWVGVGVGLAIWDDDTDVVFFVCRTAERDVRRARLCRHCTI